MAPCFLLRPRRLKEARQQGDEAANLVQVQQHLGGFMADDPMDGPIYLVMLWDLIPKLRDFIQN